MTTDCLLLKKEDIIIKKLSKDPYNCNLRQTFSNYRSRYNKMRKKLRANHFHTLSKQINSFNPKKSKEFWSSINNYKTKDCSDTPVELTDCVLHYKQLFREMKKFLINL